MTITLDIPEPLKQLLYQEADQAGVSVADYIVALLSQRTEKSPAQTGAELVTYWREAGLIGTRPGSGESPDYSRQLRYRSERRLHTQSDSDSGSA